MAIIRCYECGKEISDKADACPGCGSQMVHEVPEYTAPVLESQESEPISVNKTDSLKILRIIVGCICGLILGVSFAVASGGGIFIVILLTAMAGIVASLDFGGFSLAVLGAIVGVVVLGFWIFIKIAMSM